MLCSRVLKNILNLTGKSQGSFSLSQFAFNHKRCRSNYSISSSRSYSSIVTSPDASEAKQTESLTPSTTENDSITASHYAPSKILTSNEKKAWSAELERSLKYPDYFHVAEMFTVEDLFNNRIHLGHREGTLNEYMIPYIFGSRLSHLIFDLDQTAEHLRRALNFLAHMTYREGISVFACRSAQLQHSVEEIARSCGEYAHCRWWREGVLTNSNMIFKGVVRLPDVVILLNTHDHLMQKHTAVHDAAKMRVPTIGIVDTNVDPRLITYPIPGNDDSYQSVLYFAKTFASVINKAKRKRERFFEKLQKQ